MIYLGGFAVFSTLINHFLFLDSSFFVAAAEDRGARTYVETLPPRSVITSGRGMPRRRSASA